MSRAPRGSLSSRIGRTVIVMFLVLTAAFWFVVRVAATRGMERFVFDDVTARHREAASGLVMVLDELNLLYSRMVLSDELFLLLQDGTLGPADKARLFRQMMDRVGVNHGLFGDVRLLFGDEVYSMAGDAFGDGGSIGRRLLPQILTSARLVEPGGVVFDQSGEAFVVIGKRMVNYPTAAARGAVLFFIRETALRKLAEAVSNGVGYSLVVTGDGLVVTHTRGLHVGAHLVDAGALRGAWPADRQVRTIDGERVLVIATPLGPLHQRYGLDWTIVSVIPHDTLLQDVIRLNRYNLGLGLVMALGAALLSMPLAAGITRPIHRLVRRLRRFSQTGQKEPASGRVRDELWELEATYDEMVERITDLMRKNEERMEAQRKLELEALQMQINPHFLYNTLDAIAWMAKLEKKPNIARLAIALAKFFRISLHKGDKFITVAEEIELVKHFIDIELIRFPDKFTVEYRVDPDVQQELTLKLILQPVVENAIKHGVSLLDRGGHLQIKAYGDREHVWFEVIDNGVGFDPPADLLAPSAAPGKARGYGLRNVDERIKLQYGPECGVQVFSAVGEGTRVVLKIKRSSAASWPASA
ncbi:MAG: sensor histidine kinase [Firmicutes bacterium]|nr:sensor histidine kinase [Bacillota bacterium]